MKLWDYKIPKNWQPKTREGWIWYLEKMIITGNLKKIKADILKKYLKFLKLDPGNKLLLEHYFFGRRKGN